MHRTEVKINRRIASDSDKSGGDLSQTSSRDDTELKLYIKPLNKESAFNKGVEYGVEFVVLYGSLFAFTVYEIKKSAQKSDAEKLRQKKISQDID